MKNCKLGKFFACTALMFAASVTANGAWVPENGSGYIEIDLNGSLGYDPEWEALQDFTDISVGELYLENSESNPKGESFLVGQGQIFSGNADFNPMLSLSASASAHRSEPVNFSHGVYVTGRILYQVVVNQREDSILLYQPPIFVSATASVSITVSTSSDRPTDIKEVAGAGMQVKITTPELETVMNKEWSANLLTGNLEDTYSARFQLPSNIPVARVTLTGEAGAKPTYWNDGTNEVQAIVDPIFKFDQPAMDAWAAANGLPTIQLADVFQFEYSPGIGPVPEPATHAGLMAGGSLLLLRRRSSVSA